LRIVNLAFLASIAFLPFPTSVIAEYPTTASSVRFYAMSVCAVGYLLAALTLVSRRPSLLQPEETWGGTVRAVIYALVTPTVFLITGFIAGYKPVLAMRLWWLVIPALIGASWLGRMIQTRIDQPAG